MPAARERVGAQEVKMEEEEEEDAGYYAVMTTAAPMSYRPWLKRLMPAASRPLVASGIEFFSFRHRGPCGSCRVLIFKAISSGTGVCVRRLSQQARGGQGKPMDVARVAVLHERE